MTSTSTNLPGEETPASPLAGLHKMSTTAGVADQAYVAVNNTAVVAAVLGLASSLTLFSPLMLIVPAVGLVVSVLAIRQIRSSNGTQTGMIVAIVGALLCLGFGIGVSAMEISEHNKLRQDGKIMDGVAHQLAGLLQNKKYDDAYQLFDINFQSRVNRELFDGRWNAYQSSSTGKIKTIEWNQVNPIIFDVQKDSQKIDIGDAIMNTQFENGAGKFVFRFIRVNGQWKIFGLPDVFPEEKPKK